MPDFIAGSAQLAPEPYLADVARLDWAVHEADRAADDETPAQGLSLLTSHDAAALHLRLRAGHAVLQSTHPVHPIWAAHRNTAADRFDPVRQAFAEVRPEAVRVRRDGLRVAVDHIDDAMACFERAVGAGQTLAQALETAGETFDFETWFIDTLRRNGLAAVTLSPSQELA